MRREELMRGQDGRKEEKYLPGASSVLPASAEHWSFLGSLKKY